MTDTDNTGLLFVCAEIGDNVTEAEFNDWYDNELGPLRLTVPGFKNGQRYFATDALAPCHLALWDLSSPSVPASAAYKALSTTASARERALVARLPNIYRSVFSLISTTYPAGATSAPAPASAYPTPYILVVTALAPPALAAEFNSWYEDEHLALLARVPGLVRIRRYRVHAPTTQLAGTRGDTSSGSRSGNRPSRDPEFNHLALLDVTRDDFSQLPEFAQAVDTAWSRTILPQVKETINIRRFKLHRVIQKPKYGDLQ